MRKVVLIIVLAVLALFTQCKKQENTGTEEPSNGIKMELTADNGGSKTCFGANGSIVWNANEKIYVVTNGQCVGYVTNGNEEGNIFTGTLNISSGTYDFHYYYVGNTQTIATGATDFTMDFSDQDGTLANLGDFHVGYGVQTDVDVTEGETVTAQASMKSLVAMAYFDIAGMAEAGEKVFFYGDNINNQMNIDFSDNTTTFDKVSVGWICAGVVSSGAYVILLPNHTDGTEELPTDITFVSKRTVGTCNDVFNYGIVGGRFYCSNGDVDTPITVSADSYAQGALRGLFSVASGMQVRFSQGNLQYIGSAATPYWKFAENQNDYLGTTTGQNSTSETVDRDLFGWGTSGWDNGNVYYQPYDYRPLSGSHCDEYGYGYGPTDGTSYEYDLTGTYANADWGVYNAISNGGNTPNQWRTPTWNEWRYMLKSRSTPSGVRYAKGIVNGVNGVILLPDGWSASSYALNNTNTSEAPFSANEITAKSWATIEAAGAVFLPAAGMRDYESVLDAGSYSGYWSASHDANRWAFSLQYLDTYLDTDYSNRFFGFSVRVVRDAE